MMRLQCVVALFVVCLLVGLADCRPSNNKTPNEINKIDDFERLENLLDEQSEDGDRSEESDDADEKGEFDDMDDESYDGLDEDDDPYKASELYALSNPDDEEEIYDYEEK